MFSPLAGTGALALAATVGSTAFIVWGVLRTTGQLAMRPTRRS